MNWREQPHLFANGCFWVKHEYFLDKPTPIDGIDGQNFICERLSCLVKDCQLIARPISDMSDEETKPLAWSVKEIKNSLNDPDLSDIPSGDLLHLLSIGVYPFEDTNDVIWRYENG